MQNYHTTVVMAVDNVVQQAEECCKLSLQRVKYMGKYICRKLCKIEANAYMKDGLRYESATRESQYSPEISFIHTSLMTLTNSVEDPGCFCDTKSFILNHKFSIKLKSGLFPG